MASIFKRGGSKTKGYWYASWIDHQGKRQTKCTRTTDKATAERIARKHEADAAKRREGLVDVDAEQFAVESRRTIADHLVDYRAKLESSGRTPRYINDAIGYVERAAVATKIEILSDLTATKIERYAAGLAQEGKSARTIQATLSALQGFTRWLLSGGKLPRDPLAAVKKPNPQANRRRERRMLLPGEWPYLLDATASGPVRRGMTGPERALLYRVAIATGLRANELRSLTRSSVVLDATCPYVLVKPSDTKNAKLAQQFIDSDLAGLLREHIATKLPKSRLFTMPDRTKLAPMIRADLAAARDAWLKEAIGNP